MFKLPVSSERRVRMSLLNTKCHPKGTQYSSLWNPSINIWLCVCAPVCVQLCEAVIPVEGVEPNKVSVFHDRVDFVGSSKTQNISILLWNITFEDQGQYICFAKNPKEKNRNHSAIFTLYVVEQSTWQETHTQTHTVQSTATGCL